MRKGQISLFIIIGIVIIVAIVSFLFFKNILTLEKLKKSFSPSLAEADVVGVLAFVNDCVKTTGLEGIATVANIQTELKQHIESNVKYCISNFNSFKNKGFDIVEKSQLKVDDIIFSSDVIYIVIEYPLIIKKFNRAYEFNDGYAEIPLVEPVVQLILSKQTPPILPQTPIIPHRVRPIISSELEEKNTGTLRTAIKRSFNCPFISEIELKNYCDFKQRVSPLDTGLSCLDVFMEKRPKTITFLASFLESNEDARSKYDRELLSGKIKEIQKGNVLLKELGGKYYLFIHKDRTFVQVIVNVELCENFDDLGKYIYRNKIK